MEKKQLTNFLTEDNGVTIRYITSETSGGVARNVLNAHERQIWLSESFFPQDLTFDIRYMRMKSTRLGLFGWKCWHAYTSNPRRVEVHLSQDGVDWTLHAVVEGEKSSSLQLFEIDVLPPTTTFLRMSISNSYGAQKTYVNQVYLWERDGTATTPCVSPIPLSNTPIHMQSPVPNYYNPPSRNDRELRPTVKPYELLNQKLWDMSDFVNCMHLNSQLTSTHIDNMQCSLMTPRTQVQPSTQFSPMTSNTPRFEEERQLKQQVNTLETAVVSMKRMMLELGSKLDQTFNSRADDPLPLPALDAKLQDWQESVLTPKLQEITARLEQKISKIAFSGRPMPPPQQVDKTEVNSIMAKLNAKLSEKSEKLRQLESGKAKRRRSPPDNFF